MPNSQKFVIGLTALAIVIGAGMYLSRKPTSPANPPPDLRRIAAETTNRPIVHAQRPSRTAEASNESDPSDPQMLRAKVDEYLRRHNRNSASLLAAFHALQDTNFLCEAATNFPNDPRVQRTVLARNAFPEDRRKWLDAFKASSPSNSLANYLSAQDYFKNHQPDAAIKELLAASGNSQFNQYSMDNILDSESFNQFNGSSPVETHVSAMSAMAGDNLPELASLKSLAAGIKDAQQQYLNSGDPASVQNLAQAGVLLADRLTSGDSGKFAINQLVALASEAVVLNSLDQNTSYDFLGGESPAQRLAELNASKASFQQLNKTTAALFPTMSEDQMIGYWDRIKIYGEVPAMQWLQQQSLEH